MITENLSIFKIHKLTQAQYDRELAAGNIDENALYLTPEEEIDLSPYATIEQLDSKANTSHNHEISDITNLQSTLDDKADLSHTHNYAGKNVEGEVFTIDGVEVTAGSGAEVFNDYTFNIASGNYSHAEGEETTASGDYSHAEGIYTTASGDSSHAEGEDTLASNINSHAEGYSTIASGDSSHAEGIGTIASGESSHAEGSSTTASGESSHAEGSSTTASGESSHAEGQDTEAYGTNSHAEGKGTQAYGYNSHAEGKDTIAYGKSSHAEGERTMASGYCSHAAGYHTTADYYQYVIGKYNSLRNPIASVDTVYNASDTVSTTYPALFIVGNGTDDTSRSNAFTVYANGKCKGLSSFGSSGADYARQYEWLDGNPNNEDRRGLLVVLDGSKIRIATPDDDIEDCEGIVSTCPAFVENDPDEWHDRYLKDVFGRRITQEVIIPEETITKPVKKIDEKTGETVIEEVIEVIPEHTIIQFVVNPKYDPEQEYVRRDVRPEWTVVGFSGFIVAVDDGTCQVNGYCTVGKNGSLTMSETRTAYRVMERKDDNHILVRIK